MALYLAHVVPGLEELAGQDMRRSLPSVRIVETLQRFDERTSLLLFRYGGAAADLLRWRMTEDVFVLAADVPDVPAGWSGLRVLRAQVARARYLPAAAETALLVRRQRKGKPTYRVIARKAGDHAYRRQDLERAVELGIEDRVKKEWRPVTEQAGLELWAHLIAQRFLLAIRLSDNSMRQRTYRSFSLPAALKPTIAYAMVTLTEPHADDVFLDPMCGSGTILIERAQTGRYRQLLGGDSDEEAVAATRANVGRRYQPIAIHQWDAADLPLDAGSVAALGCNLPFGKQIGTPAAVKGLYPRLLTEWARVVSPGARLALLSSERSVLERALRARAKLRLEHKIPILVRGQPATIYSLKQQ